MKNSFKNAALLFLVLCVLGYGVFAQENSLLYKVSGNGLQQPSYIYGTIHMICPKDMLMTEATKNAIDETSQLVLEMDMTDPGFQTKVSQLSLNEGMKNFSTELSKEELASLNSFFTAKFNASMTQLGVVKPFGLMSMMYTKALTCDQIASYEASFIEMNGDKEVLGLETVEEQLSVVAGIPQEEQIDWLVEYAADFDKMKKEFDEMIGIYLSQDVEHLHDYMAKNSTYSAYNESMLYGRNKNWIEPIKSIISDNPSFIAVGAAHLGSERGIIELLRKEGYKVEPVKNK